MKIAIITTKFIYTIKTVIMKKSVNQFKLSMLNKISMLITNTKTNMTINMSMNMIINMNISRSISMTTKKVKSVRTTMGLIKLMIIITKDMTMITITITITIMTMATVMKV